MRRRDETLAHTIEEVGEAVASHWGAHFESGAGVTCEDRWGSWDRFREWDTGGMGSSFRRLFEGCYRRMYVKIGQKAEAEGWWGAACFP